MADEPKLSEVDTLAFEIYSKRASSGGLRAGEQDAIASYRAAETFLAVRAKVRKGELKPATQVNELADCCAPNLPKTNPHNLVAQLHTDRNGVQTRGDVQRVSRIMKWLKDNPTPENNPDELVNRIGREFPELGWGLPEINTARAIFPAFAKA